MSSPKANQPNNRLVIIDGNSLINRAYYAIRRPMITKEGLYTHGVYGFLNMLQKIQKEYEPSYLAVAFDRKAPTFRHMEYTEYKADRKGMPVELAMQLPVLKDILEAMHIKMLEIDGFEADDILGTVVKRGEEEGFSPIVITGDRDALQLASDQTKIIITKKGISEFETYDREAILEEYGFAPEQIVDLKGLMGDSSDNIPGLPGVGEKTAQKLILEFGSVENLIANADRIANEKLREKVRENTTIALMSRRLAEIHTNVPIDLEFQEFQVREPDYGKLIDLYKKLEFNSFLNRMKPKDEPGQRAPGVNAMPLKERQRYRIHAPEELEMLEASLKDGKNVCMKVMSDQNHRDIPEIYGIAFMTEHIHCYIDGNPAEMLGALEQMFQKTGATVYGHNLQPDFYALRSLGFQSLPRVSFDSAVAQYLLQPERSSYDLKPLSLEYFHKDFKDKEEFSSDGGQLGFLGEMEVRYDEYGVQWCETVEMLRKVMEDRLSLEDLMPVLEKIELPLIPVLAAMEARGFAVDSRELLAAGETLTAQLLTLTREIYLQAGTEFNINSPKQLGEILFERLKLPAGKKTKTGYSTNAEILESLRDYHEIIGLILEYRTLSKLNGTYVEGLLPLVHKDGRIHAHFRQTVTATGRISCTEPNLQNIPIRQEAGRALRKVFIPRDENYVLVGADYSQIELRVLAHMSQDPSLIEAFNQGLDIHKATASRVFGVPESEVTPLMRSNAKAVNFGVIYGMSSFGLSAELNISRKQAEIYIRDYFHKHQKVKEYMDNQVEFAKKYGYVTTIMNRKRHIHEINAANHMVRQAGERLAMNSPIQGSAADIIKLAMILCHEEMEREQMRSGLILQVHDELIIEAHKDELSRVEALLAENMINAVKLSVTLTVDLNTGNNWYELK